MDVQCPPYESLRYHTRHHFERADYVRMLLGCYRLQVDDPHVVQGEALCEPNIVDPPHATHLCILTSALEQVLVEVMAFP